MVLTTCQSEHLAGETETRMLVLGILTRALRYAYLQIAL